MASVSARVAPGSIVKLPVTEPCSGALKKRQPTSPRTIAAACTASARTASASTG
jgi:hypothetical protein